MTFRSVARKPDNVVGKINPIMEMDFGDISASNTSGIVGYQVAIHTVDLSRANINRFQIV